MKGTYGKAELVFGLTRLAGHKKVIQVSLQRGLQADSYFLPRSRLNVHRSAPAKDVVPEEFSLNVTGVGLINPLGVGTEQNRKTILNVKSATYACRFASEAKGFVPEDFIERKDVKPIRQCRRLKLSSNNL